MPEQIPTAAQSAAKLVDMVTGIAQDARPRQTMIGVVIASPPDIKVQLNDIILTKEDVYISEYLLVGYERTAKGVIKSETQPQRAAVVCLHLQAILTILITRTRIISFTPIHLSPVIEYPLFRFIIPVAKKTNCT